MIYAILFVIFCIVVYNHFKLRKTYKMAIKTSENIDEFRQDIINQVDIYFEEVVKPEIINIDTKSEDLLIRVSTLEVSNKK